jgi:hypothetical protein
MRLGHAPKGERGRRKRHGKEQSGGDEELRLVTHRKSQGLPCREGLWGGVICSGAMEEPFRAAE